MAHGDVALDGEAHRQVDGRVRWKIQGIIIARSGGWLAGCN